MHARQQLFDAAFGYLQSVLVTPAVYPCLQQFLACNGASTEQESHSVCSVCHLSECYVLIIQSDSPILCQFSSNTYDEQSSAIGAESVAQSGTSPRNSDPPTNCKQLVCFESQYFFQSYISILPSSLAYIVLNS